MIPSDSELESYNAAVAKLIANEKRDKEARELGQKYIHQYFKALVQAKSENKQILMVFYMNGCNPCTVLKYLLSYNEKIVNLINEKQYIKLLYNVSEAKCPLIDKYNIYNFPSYFILDSDEKVIKKGNGYLVGDNPEDYLLNWLQ
jgi:thioredoxin-related protein